MTQARFAAARERLGGRFEAALTAHLDTWTDWPPALAAPCRYALQSGGKRVRPLLAMLAAEAVGGSAEAALPWALALEHVHTYSLVHDDLPAMDDDDERRGQPTVHVKFGEAMAILAGDTLLTEAFRVLGTAAWPAATTARLVALLAGAAGGGGMVGGQAIDIGGEPIPDAAALMRLQRLKTAALFRVAAEGGALAAGADDATARALSRYGETLGLLFQVTDDLLDREQDAVVDGSSYLHHFADDEVLAHRDRLAAEARAALEGLPAAGLLGDLVDLVGWRTV